MQAQHLLDCHVEHLSVIAESLVRRRKDEDEARGFDVKVALVDSNSAKRGVAERVAIGTPGPGCTLPPDK